MKCVLIVCVIAIVLFPAVIFSLGHSQQNDYNNINADDSVGDLINKMGMPKMIDVTHESKNYQEWVYYIWPIPKTYTFIVVNNVIEGKNESISP